MAVSHIRITSKGKYDKVTKYLNRLYNTNFVDILNKYGEMGVEELRKATPVDSGKTKDSWVFSIEKPENKLAQIVWSNTNLSKDWFCVALFLQLGHGTRTGGYVQGIDYINPALKPVFDKIVEDACKEISEL